MSHQSLMACIQELEKQQNNPRPVFKKEDVKAKAATALETGKGDLRRYGCLLESTITDIEWWITFIAQWRDFDEAYRKANIYGQLIKEQQETVNT